MRSSTADASTSSHLCQRSSDSVIASGHIAVVDHQRRTQDQGSYRGSESIFAASTATLRRTTGSWPTAATRSPPLRSRSRARARARRAWTRRPPRATGRGVVGLDEHVLQGLLVVGAVGEVAPVLAGQLPALERVALAGAEAAQLLVLGDVQPELDEDQPLDRPARARSRRSADRRAATPASVANPSTRSTSTRPYQERSSTAMPPQPGSAGAKRCRKWWRRSSSLGAANWETRTWRGSSGTPGA
jgi:hypothetical protein